MSNNRELQLSKFFVWLRWTYITGLAQPKHTIFRSSRRGRPNLIPTFILISWTPWSLYSHPTRIRYNLPHHLSRKREERSFRKFRNNLCHNSNWIARVCSMITPHIYSRNRCWYTSILYINNNNYCLRVTCTWRLGCVNNSDGLLTMAKHSDIYIQGVKCLSL